MFYKYFQELPLYTGVNSVFFKILISGRMQILGQKFKALKMKYIPYLLPEIVHTFFAFVHERIDEMTLELSRFDGLHPHSGTLGVQR